MYLIPVLLLLLLLGSHLYLRSRRRPLRLRQEVPVVTFAPSSALSRGRARKPYELPSARVPFLRAPSALTGETMDLCRSISSTMPASGVTLAVSSTQPSMLPWPTRYTPPLVTPGSRGPVSREENR